MAPRLQHKKSRTGCRRCKTRRVKCDETKPSCRNCGKHGVSCEYDDIFNNLSLRRLSMVLPSGSGDASPLSAAPSPKLSPPRDSSVGLIGSPYGHQGSQEEEIDPSLGLDEHYTLEARLLHHYTSVVVYTLPSGNEKQYRHIWTVDAVRLGFEHPFLLNTILSLSSLHLLSEPGSRASFSQRAYLYSHDSNDRLVKRLLFNPAITIEDTDLEKAHESYLNLATRQQREAISNLNASNVDAIFLASVLLSYQTLRLSRPERPVTATYTPPTHWLSMCKAISSIVQASHSIRRQDSVVTTILSMSCTPDFRDKFAFFNPMNRAPFAALLDYDAYPEPDLDAKARAAYEHTLAYVGSVYRALLDGEPPRTLIRRLMTLGIMVPGYFITLLAQGRPRALAILAQHFAIAQAVDGHWYFRGAAEREVNGIRSVLPEEWLWAMEWPTQMIGVCKAEWLKEGS